MPVVCSVLSWVVGVYACMTFNLPGTFAWQMGIGLVFLLACTAWNILWPTLSGYFQNLTTLAKALPLVLVGVIGLMVNDPVAQLSSDIAAAPAAGTAWIAAAAPIAFAFDGWSSAVSIAPELKDARRNLPRALVAAPIIILVLYLGYFVGISCFLGPQTVIEAGDASLSLMFVKLFGEQAGALPNVIAFIAVLGGANGMVLATLRMPQSLALHHMMPFEHIVSRMNPTLRFPVVSAMIALRHHVVLGRGAHGGEHSWAASQRRHLRGRGGNDHADPAAVLHRGPAWGAVRGCPCAHARTPCRSAGHRTRQLARHRPVEHLRYSTRWPFVVAFTALLLVMTFALTPKRDA